MNWTFWLPLEMRFIINWSTDFAVVGIYSPYSFPFGQVTNGRAIEHIFYLMRAVGQLAPRIHVNQLRIVNVLIKPSHFSLSLFHSTLSCSPSSDTLADLSMPATLVNRDEKELQGEEIKVWRVWQGEDGGWDRWHEVCGTLAWFAWC